MNHPYSRESKISNMIGGAMVRRKIKTQKELSEYSGIKESPLSKKMNGQTPWTVPDFWKLDKVLKFEQDEWYTILEVARR